jgi:hypothetical protein
MAKPTRRAEPFDSDRCRVFAVTTLALPPALPRLTRPERHGGLLYAFVLPLSVCPSSNTTGRAGMAGQGWRMGKLKSACWGYMKPQSLRSRDFRLPLPGRPQIIATRFSTNEPDSCCNWAKIPIDMLTVARTINGRTQQHRLGIIVDDAPKHVDVVQRWEPAKRGQGFVYLEIYEGEPTW